MGKVRKANAGKRTRLSAGAEYRKKRNAKKSFIESQKGAILKFLPKQNELSSSDNESELSNNSDSNEEGLAIRKNISPLESTLSDKNISSFCHVSGSFFLV